MKQPNKILLYTGLGLLSLAVSVRWTGIFAYCFYPLLVMAILFKISFLVSVFRTKGFQPALWIYFILAGVAMIFISMLFKTVFPAPLLRNILFYGAILLKIIGLILMLRSKKNKK
jgi:dolichyl-phosphate-mannose--protein O-mannosyl transferase